MKKRQVSYIPFMGTKLNNEVFKNKSGWEYKLKELLKKENVSISTNDVLPTIEADFCLVFDNMYYQIVPKIWELYHKKLLHKTVYIDYEPPTGHCKNHDDKGIKHLSKIFNKVITYNDDLVDNKRIIKGNIANFFSEEISYNKDFKNRKLICMVANNTNNKEIIDMLNFWNSTKYFNNRNIRPHKKSIYHKRLEAAKFFSNKTNEFDLYGNKWPNKLGNCLKGGLLREEKIQTISQYKFIVSFDSFYKQNGYISEKIFDAFISKTIPIYLGANNIKQYIPENCFIDFNNFSSYEKLYEYLCNMTEKEFESRIKSIEEFLVSEKFKNIFSSNASAKIIKEALLSDSKDFDYNEAYKSLMYFQKKKDKVDKYKSVILNYNKKDNKDTTYNYVNLEFKSPHCVENIQDIKVLVNNKSVPIVRLKQEVINQYSFKEIKFNAKIKSIELINKIEVYFKIDNKYKKIQIDANYKKFNFKDIQYLIIKKDKVLYYNGNSNKINKLYILLRFDLKLLLTIIINKLFKFKKISVKYIKENNKKKDYDYLNLEFRNFDCIDNVQDIKILMNNDYVSEIKLDKKNKNVKFNLEIKGLKFKNVIKVYFKINGKYKKMRINKKYKRYNFKDLQYLIIKNDRILYYNGNWSRIIKLYWFIRFDIRTLIIILKNKLFIKKAKETI